MPASPPDSSQQQRTIQYSDFQQENASPRLVPRPASPATAQRIQTKNRRRRYLELHPEYFDAPDRELADPLAYDSLIRRFQTLSEREEEGKRKGYAGVLEADFWRMEARAAAGADGVDEGLEGKERWGGDGGLVEVENGQGLDSSDESEMPRSKEEGQRRWRREMELRLLRGEDADFEYGAVDEGEEFDDWGDREREEEERWFESEEATWLVGKGEGEGEWKVDLDGGLEKGLKGQTGVQDF